MSTVMSTANMQLTVEEQSLYHFMLEAKVYLLTKATYAAIFLMKFAYAYFRSSTPSCSCRWDISLEINQSEPIMNGRQMSLILLTKSNIDIV